MKGKGIIAFAKGAREQGWTVEDAPGGHIKFVHVECGRMVMASSTPRGGDDSNVFWIKKNIKAHFRQVHGGTGWWF